MALAIPFVAARNRRNYFFVALLVLLSAASLTVHLDQLGVLKFPGWIGIQVALDALLFIMAVMGGRVIPMFTNNGIPGAGATRQPLVEKAALAGVRLLVTISAPTALALERAEGCGLTLIALARADEMLVAADPHAIFTSA